MFENVCVHNDDVIAFVLFQARASGDYARPEGNMQPWDNVATLGGASLLLGATHMAPSKDTLWTASPQPPTSSDRTTKGYHTQPHVQLDSILATLSLGPVGISDGLNETDAGLISQAFKSATDSTLLRPSRPLSTVDAVFTNKSLHAAAAAAAATGGGAVVEVEVDCKTTGNPSSGPDIRSTHAALADGGSPISHYVLAWMTTSAATLQSTDLYPAPAAGTKLAVRQHVVAPYGAGQYAGCVDGKPASSGCITVLPAGTMPTIASVGGAITDYSLTVVYEPLSNGAYFLGEPVTTLPPPPPSIPFTDQKCSKMHLWDTHPILEGKGRDATVKWRIPPDLYETYTPRSTALC